MLPESRAALQLTITSWGVFFSYFYFLFFSASEYLLLCFVNDRMIRFGHLDTSLINFLYRSSSVL